MCLTTVSTAGSLVWFDPDSGENVVYNLGDIAWVLASTALVWIMIPGVGFFYSGLLRRKNALSMIWLSMMVLAVVSFQACLSCAYNPSNDRRLTPDVNSGSSGASHLPSAKQVTPTSATSVSVSLRTALVLCPPSHHSDAEYFGLKGVLEKPSIGSTRIPSIAFCVFQLMFAAITPMLALGAVAERARLGPTIVFTFLWSTLVYDPIACWTWNSNGWSFVLGGLDFAGGTPVHISSGTAALAISIYLGKRRGYGTERLAYKPHNTTYVVLGTIFLWFGWFGFNGGSALSANLRAVQACIVTNLAASVGGLTWMFWVRGIPFPPYSGANLLIAVVERNLGLSPRAQVVRCWLLLRRHLRLGSHHARIRLRRVSYVFSHRCT